MKKLIFAVTVAAVTTTAALAQASGIFDLHYRNARVHTDAEARRFRNRCLRPDEAAQVVVFPSVDRPGDLIVQYPDVSGIACTFFNDPICDKRCGDDGE